jgi:hypothetical protein
MIIDFSHHGDLPSQAKVMIYVDMGFTTGQALYLYYFNSETGKLETLPYSLNYKVDKDGYVTLNLVHCSKYVFLSQKADNSMITSLLNQIHLSAEKTTLYLEKTKDSSVAIDIILPSTLELVKDLKDETSGSAVGAVTASYQSSNKNIVVVSNKGKITAKGTGKAVITVTVKLYSGKTRTFKVKVTVKKHRHK